MLALVNTNDLLFSTGLSFTAEVDTTHILAANGSQGTTPTNSMIIGNDGNLYGTTWTGGSSDGGTFYKVVPSWNTPSYTVLHHFADGSVNNDGFLCHGRLAKDNSGYIYGACEGGGTYSGGIVYRMNPSNGAVTILHQFGSVNNDGYFPYGGIAIDTATGNLYGTTWLGDGSSCTGGGAQCGIIWKLAPSGGGWTYTVLHRFAGGSNGQEPVGGITLASDGKLYGIAHTASSIPDIIYRYNLSTNTYTVLYTMPSSTGGAEESGLTQIPTSFTSGGKLEFWGTNYFGGANGVGSIYKLSETSAGSGSFNYSTMHSFNNASGGGYYEGYNPWSSLIFSTNLNSALDGSGMLYGTTIHGGPSLGGTLYKIDLSGNFTDLNYHVAIIDNGWALDQDCVPWGLIQGTIVNGTSTKQVLFGSSMYETNYTGTGWLWHFWWYI
jgi:uncharacterized repeat protein (TIGR03803 family)